MKEAIFFKLKPNVTKFIHGEIKEYYVCGKIRENWPENKFYDIPLERLKDCLLSLSKPFNSNLLSNKEINWGNEEIYIVCKDNICRISASFMEAIKDESKQEIYEEIIEVSQSDLNSMLKLFISFSRNNVETLTLSRDDLKFILLGNDISIELPFKFNQNTSKYHMHGPEDLDENGLHCTYDQDKKDEEDQCECNKE